MDARDRIVEDVRVWREQLAHEIEGMKWAEALELLHRRSDEAKAGSGLCLASASASDAARARRQAV